MTQLELFAGPYKAGGFDFDANVTGAVTVLPGAANLVTQMAAFSKTASFTIHTKFSKRRQGLTLVSTFPSALNLKRS